MMCDGTTEERIAAVVPTINVIHPVEQAFVDFTQESYFNESKTGDGDLLPDVVVIKRYIKLAIAMNGPNRTHINAFTRTLDRGCKIQTHTFS